MLTKIKTTLKFNPKRSKNLTTPCCNSNTKDLKFVNFINLPNNYGKCFSCGKTTLPPTIYKDKNGNEFTWNSVLKKFESFTDSIITRQVNSTNKIKKDTIKQRFIDESVVWKYFNFYPENNLLKYLRRNYHQNDVDLVKELYVIGTSQDGGTIFWLINKNLKIQKNKISYYRLNGKRTKHFKVPYKNDNGFFSCLFGEHLLSEFVKKNGIVILVESEKTAIVGQILLPKYVWLAYGGSTALTDKKSDALIGFTVLIVPDISSSAFKLINDKLPYLINKGVNASVWDMRNGFSDEELKLMGLYNLDLEDVFRAFGNNKQQH